MIYVQGPFDNFRRIKFKVTESPPTVYRMVVTYYNGARDRIDVLQKIKQGGESRGIDLRGIGKRGVCKIEFWYETKRIVNGQVDVTRFGMH